MPVGSSLTVYGAKQVESLDDTCWFEVKGFLDQHGDLFFIYNGRPKSIDGNRNRIRNTNGISDLDFTAAGQTGSNDVFGNVSCSIGSGTIHLRRIFSGKCSTSMTSHSSIGVNDDFASCQSTISLGSSNFKDSSRVDVEISRISEKFCRDHWTNDIFDDVLFQLTLVLSLFVLGADHNGSDFDRFAVDVFDRDLRFSVGSEFRHGSIFTDL